MAPTLTKPKPAKAASRKPPATKPDTRMCKITHADKGKTTEVTITMAQLWSSIPAMKQASAAWSPGHKVTFEILAK